MTTEEKAIHKIEQIVLEDVNASKFSPVSVEYAIDDVYKRLHGNPWKVADFIKNNVNGRDIVVRCYSEELGHIGIDAPSCEFVFSGEGGVMSLSGKGKFFGHSVSFVLYLQKSTGEFAFI